MPFHPRSDTLRTQLALRLSINATICLTTLRIYTTITKSMEDMVTSITARTITIKPFIINSLKATGSREAPALPSP